MKKWTTKSAMPIMDGFIAAGGWMLLSVLYVLHFLLWLPLILTLVLWTLGTMSSTILQWCMKLIQRQASKVELWITTTEHLSIDYQLSEEELTHDEEAWLEQSEYGRNDY